MNRTHAALLALALLTACGEEEVELTPALNPDNNTATIQVAHLDQEDKASLVTVDVPASATSLALVLDAGDRLVTAGTITNPAGAEVFSFQKDISTHRTDPTDGVYTVLIPNNPAVSLDPGPWTFTFLTDQPDGFSADLQALFKTTPASADTLDLHLHFVGLDDLDAASAPNDANFQSILQNVSQIYESTGLQIGEVAYHDITGDDAARFSVLDSTSGPSSELAQLLTRSAARSGPALNLFFVADIESAGGGFSLLGLSGGVPGPPGVHGTTSSGVVVNMADFADDPASIELIMAHEAGHYLGLYHTTEANGAALQPPGRDPIQGADPLSDTPQCGDGADADANGVLSASECASADGGNLMFWSPTNSSRALSSQQGAILRNNPLIR
jgi:hypothetical protein